MSLYKSRNAAVRYKRLAEHATTPSVRRHLLRLAHHHEVLEALSTAALPDAAERNGDQIGTVNH